MNVISVVVLISVTLSLFRCTTNSLYNLHTPTSWIGIFKQDHHISEIHESSQMFNIDNTYS